MSLHGIAPINFYKTHTKKGGCSKEFYSTHVNKILDKVIANPEQCEFYAKLCRRLIDDERRERPFRYALIREMQSTVENLVLKKVDEDSIVSREVYDAKEKRVFMGALR